MTVYSFPGQGSQYQGMGASLFIEFPDIVEKANQILGYSIVDLCLKDPNEQLKQTLYTQPALYVINALSFLKKSAELPEKPQYVVGHSLGEYNALLAARVFDFETGLLLVKKRAELMNQANGGAMAAAVGLTAEAVQAILTKENLKEVSIANYNSYEQIVISGPKNAISSSHPLFEEAGAMLFVPLKVSGAFHSSHMQAAQEAFSHFVDQFTFYPPTIPVIANVTALPYKLEDTSTLLAKQITSSVQWTASMEYLLKKGEKEFIEIGPGTVLTRLIRRIRNGQ